MRYILSGVYVDLKQIDKAAEQLETLLKDDPDNPTYLNDLGFIWADHDMKLDEAEKLIRKAIDKDREQRKKIEDLPKDEDDDNAAYLDSLGWVLYKKKEYKEAKKYLRARRSSSPRASTSRSTTTWPTPTWPWARRTEAIKVWKDALALDKD